MSFKLGIPKITVKDRELGRVVSIFTEILQQLIKQVTLLTTQVNTLLSADTGWYEIQLAAGWTTSQEVPAIKLKADGTIRIKGRIQYSGTPATPVTFTAYPVPEKFRAKNTVLKACPCSPWATHDSVMLHIQTNGTMQIYGANYANPDIGINCSYERDN